MTLHPSYFTTGLSGDKVKTALLLNGSHYHIPCAWLALPFFGPAVPGNHSSRSPWSLVFGRRQARLVCSWVFFFLLVKYNCIRSCRHLRHPPASGPELTVVIAFTVSRVPSIFMSTDSCQKLLCAPGGKVVVSLRLTVYGRIDWRSGDADQCCSPGRHTDGKQPEWTLLRALPRELRT